MPWRASPSWRKAWSTSTTYRITPLSLWNAAAAGLDAASIVGGLERFGKSSCQATCARMSSTQSRGYGRVKLVQEGQHLLLVSDDRPLLVEIERHKHIAPCLIGRHLSGGLLVDPAQTFNEQCGLGRTDGLARMPSAGWRLPGLMSTD